MEDQINPTKLQLHKTNSSNAETPLFDLENDIVSLDLW